MLIVRGRTELETSLAFLVLVLLAGAFALVLLTVLAGPLWQLLTPASWSHWRRRRAGSLRLQNGLLALAAGHWREAEEQLRAAANQTDWPLPVCGKPPLTLGLTDRIWGLWAQAASRPSNSSTARPLNANH